jgi:hypothetical protein
MKKIGYGYLLVLRWNIDLKIKLMGELKKNWKNKKEDNNLF